MIKTALILIFVFLSAGASAESESLLFKEGSLFNVAPPVINKDYYMIEYGFVVPKKIKKWNYNYNAFVNATLFEDWKDRSDHLRGGALGFKGGVMMPLLNQKFFYRVAVGFAKSVLHKNPVFGKEAQSVKKADLFLFEIGLIYKFDHLFVGANFQKNNVKFFQRELFLTVGVNY